MNQRIGVFVLIFLCSSFISLAQAPTAVVIGQVRDTSGAAIPNARVEVINDATNVRYATETNDEGIYSVPNLPPGTYHIRVSKQGFKTIVHPDITLNVQDAKAIGFILPVGPVSDTVTVEGGTPLINTQDAAVSTVVDRQFAENLPLNGRSFQTLIYETPGVVVVPSNGSDAGQFTVNGQRAESNYWMIDGVSADIGITSGNFPGNGLGGTLGAFSTQGGTNSLVSVDALQEFRIQTSTYAPEFGRTPGGQISIVTRSGTNQFHGTLFDYLRNDVFDASDWFNGATNPPLPKAKDRQNDFGGTFSGPIIKNKTFFFFSYEGLRLRLPQTALSAVPDLSARQNAVPAMQPFLNAFPLPNGPEIFTPCNPATDPSCPATGQKPTGTAQFNASFSNPSTLDAYSLRLDHRLSDKLSLFGRYSYSPSDSVSRGGPAGVAALSALAPSRSKIQTATVGATWALSHTYIDDFRFNYSSISASTSSFLDTFGGTVPLTSLSFPSPFTTQNSELVFRLLRVLNGQLPVGQNAHNLQRQINIVNTASVLKGTHSLKFGVDFRRLSPEAGLPQYVQVPIFRDMASAEAGTAFVLSISDFSIPTLLFRNLGVFAQDTWRIVPRLTMSYGLRWDVDAAPRSLSGPSLVAVTGYNLNDFSQFAIAPPGTPPFKTTYGNIAPRVGLAYQLTQSQDWSAIIRGGFGVFYDLVSSQTGGFLGNAPFGAFKRQFNTPFPPDSATAAPPPIPSSGSISSVGAFNPNLELPYTLQWNLALEQSLGKQQTVSASYVGAAGRRLLQTFAIFSPPSNPSVNARLVDNTAMSSYNALQVQFKRRLSHGLQALASYTWAHSIDDGSAGSGEIASNLGVPGSTPSANRGPSDPPPVGLTLTSTVEISWKEPSNSRYWRGPGSIENIILVRSAPPVDLSDLLFFQLNGGIVADVRPDIVPGQPFYLFGANCASVMQALGNLGPGQGCPGGKALNPNAFTDPPFDPVTFTPLRQGNVPRNFLRGFGATQWDFAVHREFPIHESVKLQFRAEMFNVLNHPNLGQPNGGFVSQAFGGPAGFGLSTKILSQYLNGGQTGGSNVGGGAFSSLYQIGGPRSIQFGLKFSL